MAASGTRKRHIAIHNDNLIFDLTASDDLSSIPATMVSVLRARIFGSAAKLKVAVASLRFESLNTLSHASKYPCPGRLADALLMRLARHKSLAGIPE